MESVFALFHYCVLSRFDAPVCAAFWIVIIGASVSLAIFILFFVFRAIYLDVRRRHAADLEEARRARVDLGAIAAARWQGDALDGSYDSSPSLNRYHILSLQSPSELSDDAETKEICTVNTSIFTILVRGIRLILYMPGRIIKSGLDMSLFAIGCWRRTELRRLCCLRLLSEYLGWVFRYVRQ